MSDDRTLTSHPSGAASEEARETSRCWECQARVALEHFCPACGKIQPLPPALDYFRFFGLPPLLNLDGAALERRYHQLAGLLESDHFQQASAYEQEIRADMVATLEEAYRTLSEPIGRLSYLLRLEGVLGEQGARVSVPAELVEEVRAANEQLEAFREAQRSGSREREVEELRHNLLRSRDALREKLEKTLEAIQSAFREWDNLVETSPAPPGRSSLLEQLHALLLRHSSLHRLAQTLGEELEK